MIMPSPDEQASTITIKFLDSLEILQTDDIQVHLNDPVVGPVLSPIADNFPSVQLQPWAGAGNADSIRRLVESAAEESQEVLR
jgi:hypothetical protein